MTHQLNNSVLSIGGSIQSEQIWERETDAMALSKDKQWIRPPDMSYKTETHHILVGVEPLAQIRCLGTLNKIDTGTERSWEQHRDLKGIQEMLSSRWDDWNQKERATGTESSRLGKRGVGAPPSSECPWGHAGREFEPSASATPSGPSTPPLSSPPRSSLSRQVAGVFDFRSFD